MSEEQIKAILGDLWRDGYKFAREYGFNGHPTIDMDGSSITVRLAISDMSRYDDDISVGDWYVWVDEEFYGAMAADKLRKDAQDYAALLNHAADICDRLNQWQKDNA